MSTDLDQFKSTFITEAYELLEDMEDKLLALEHGDYTADDINAFSVALTL